MWQLGQADGADHVEVANSNGNQYGNQGSNRYGNQNRPSIFHAREMESDQNGGNPVLNVRSLRFLTANQSSDERHT